jgi:hypothetical protein
MTRAIRLGDVVNFFEYEKVREDRRRRVIALKQKRRVQVGPYLSFVFENRETLLFQIQEMCRAERIIDDAKVQEEIDVYSALLPRPGELSATLFIEITDQDVLREWLPKLPGIQRHVAFDVAGAEVRGVEPDEERLTREDEITSTVHYLKFAFSPEQQAAFAAGPVRLVVDHPEYQAQAVLSDGQRAALAADFEA